MHLLLSVGVLRRPHLLRQRQAGTEKRMCAFVRADACEKQCDFKQMNVGTLSEVCSAERPPEHNMARILNDFG